MDEEELTRQALANVDEAPGSIFLRLAASKHFVVFTYKASAPGEPRSTAVRYSASCFVIEIDDNWLLVTAGHVIGDIARKIALKADHFDFRLYDKAAGKNFEGGVPFSFELDEWAVVHDDSEGTDYAAYPLPGLMKLNLAAGGIEPLRENAWGEPPFEDYQRWLLIGVPDESRRVVNDKVNVNIVILPLAPTTAPVGAVKQLRIFGKILTDEVRDRATVDDIAGMSGGPIFGLNVEEAAWRYWVIGIQSSWFESERVVSFCPAKAFFVAVQEVLRNRRGREAR